eukprot:scaffold280629_cov45-Prasinocladus_malaysianus.AAC.1
MTASRSAHSALIRKKNAYQNKRHQAKSLGAVKISEDLQKPHEAPQETPESVSDRIMSLDEQACQKSVDISAMSRFQNELVRTGTTEKWFEEQIAE